MRRVERLAALFFETHQACERQGVLPHWGRLLPFFTMHSNTPGTRLRQHLGWSPIEVSLVKDVMARSYS